MRYVPKMNIPVLSRCCPRRGTDADVSFEWAGSCFLFGLLKGPVPVHESLIDGGDLHCCAALGSGPGIRAPRWWPAASRRTLACLSVMPPNRGEGGGGAGVCSGGAC